MTTVQAQPKAKPLSPRRAKFVREYLKNDGNAAEAYRAAGYSPGGADRAAHKLLRIAEVATAVASRRAVIEVEKDRASVADMVECEELLTLELRGERYAQDIADLEGDLVELRQEREGLHKALDANGISAETRAMLSQSAVLVAQTILQTRVQIKNLRVKQHSGRTAAAVNLMKSKGAFDPRHPPIKDVGAILNDALASIMDSKWQPPEHVTAWMRQAEDAVYAIQARDAGTPGKALTGGAPAAVSPVLFTRKDPKQASPRDPGSVQ